MLRAVTQADLGKKLIDDYVLVFGMYSIQNEIYAKMSLHVLLGQALCKNVYYRVGARKNDIRVHLLLVKPQATGKGAGYSLIERVANYIGLIFQSLTESTDAGLVGTTELDDERNKVIVPGLLQTADIVGMEEASVIFDFTNEFSKKNMTYFQITMNPLLSSSCEINKRLGGIDIKFKPHASLILLTYPPDKLVDKLLKTGFMDRVIAVFEDVTLADRLSVLKQMTNTATASDIADQEEFVKYRLKKVIEFFQKSEICINITPEIHKLILNVIDECAMKILDASPKARDKLEHFISRLYGNLVNLTIHHALLHRRTNLEVADVLYARLTFIPIWRNLIISIESLLIISATELHRQHRIIRTSLEEYDMQIKSGKFVKENVWVRRRTMVENLKMRWDQCSTETADNNLRKLEKLPESVYGDFGKVASYEKDKFFESKPIGDVVYLRKIRDVS